MKLVFLATFIMFLLLMVYEAEKNNIIYTIVFGVFSICSFLLLIAKRLQEIIEEN